MNFDKSIGYFLLIIGVGIILTTIIYSFGVFSGKISAPDVFKKEIIIENNKKINLENISKEEMQEYLSVTIQENMNKMFPKDFTTKTANLACWGAFASIAIFAGGKMGGLGINLISKIKKEQKEG